MAAHKMPDSGLNLVMANLPSRFGATARLKKKHRKMLLPWIPHFLANSYWQAEVAFISICQAEIIIKCF